MKILPINVVKYILYKCTFIGDVITNLKMQKLLYYVYVWGLVKKGSPCFVDKFQAWPNGPVLPTVYKELKQFGALPIDPDFSGVDGQEALDSLIKQLGNSVELIDSVYEKYGSLSAFQLVNLTHNEKSWQNARQGLETDEPSNNLISDKDILMQYGEQA